MKKFNVLSLFDGVSVGQLALKMAGIKYDQYFASEIDKAAIKITSHHFPNTIHLGDVEKIDLTRLPKIHLLLGGSPCTGFSFAGKQLNFEDPQSKLFFNYVDALDYLKPTYFLLENTPMKKIHLDVITKRMGVEPILIDSNLLSAQDRKRYYWTNIPVKQPVDQGIKLRDILTTKNAVCYRYSSSGRGGGLVEGRINLCEKATTLTKTGYTKRSFTGVFDSVPRPLNIIEKTRLQTLPDGYLRGVSDSKASKLLGNGWTLKVIEHILKGISLSETKTTELDQIRNEHISTKDLENGRIGTKMDSESGQREG